MLNIYITDKLPRNLFFTNNFADLDVTAAQDGTITAGMSLVFVEGDDDIDREFTKMSVTRCFFHSRYWLEEQINKWKHISFLLYIGIHVTIYLSISETHCCNPASFFNMS